ncbi:hypothetical protein TorRG33x02_349630, partial [Trema orientale]
PRQQEPDHSTNRCAATTPRPLSHTPTPDHSKHRPSVFQNQYRPRSLLPAIQIALLPASVFLHKPNNSRLTAQPRSRLPAQTQQQPPHRTAARVSAQRTSHRAASYALPSPVLKSLSALHQRLPQKR